MYNYKTIHYLGGIVCFQRKYGKKQRESERQAVSLWAELFCAVLKCHRAERLIQQTSPQKLHICIFVMYRTEILMSYFLIVRDSAVKLPCREKSLISWYVNLIYPKDQTLKCFNQKQTVISYLITRQKIKIVLVCLLCFCLLNLSFKFFQNK